MKRRDLIRELKDLGCEFIRHGSKHDWYRSIITGECQPIPRHREIRESLAKHIIKKLS